MINEVDLFWSREGGMTAKAQGAAGTQQLPFGADVGRLQEQHDGRSYMPAGMQKAITEPDLGFVTSSPPPWENTNKSLSFPNTVRFTHQLDDSSDKIFRHLFRQITTSPSKENLSQAKTTLLLQWAIPLCPGFAAASDSPWWLCWDVHCMHHWWWIITWPVTKLLRLPPMCVHPPQIYWTGGFHRMATWPCFHLIPCRFGHQIQWKGVMNPTWSPEFPVRYQCLLIAIHCCV